MVREEWRMYDKQTQAPRCIQSDQRHNLIEAQAERMPVRVCHWQEPSAAEA